MVREGPALKLYFDGELQAEAASSTGVANIANGDDMKVGDWLRATPTARYEDLRIYHTALSAEEVAALIPPANRPLRAGEIELVAGDGATLSRNCSN
ncbi:MAG: LamG domain-containing protein [Oscillochloris sp.]|nr:LamG domain-containing protein [Oscillochloris sp.]